MKEHYKKTLLQIKSLFAYKKCVIGHHESNVTRDWLRALSGACVLGLILVCVGVYVYVSWQKNTEEGLRKDVQQSTFSGDFLKSIVSQYQLREVEFSALRRNPPNIPAVGISKNSSVRDSFFEEMETEDPNISAEEEGVL